MTSEMREAEPRAGRVEQVSGKPQAFRKGGGTAA